MKNKSKILYSSSNVSLSLRIQCQFHLKITWFCMQYACIWFNWINIFVCNFLMLGVKYENPWWLMPPPQKNQFCCFAHTHTHATAYGASFLFVLFCSVLFIFFPIHTTIIHSRCKCVVRLLFFVRLFNLPFYVKIVLRPLFAPSSSTNTNSIWIQ